MSSGDVNSDGDRGGAAVATMAVVERAVGRGEIELLFITGVLARLVATK